MSAVEELKRVLDGLTPEEIKEHEKILMEGVPTKKGWIDIEEYLPMWKAVDFMRGYSIYKVRDKDGNESESWVSDHTIWYYEAKQSGITHWLNT